MKLYNVAKKIYNTSCLWYIFTQHNHLMQGFKKPIDIFFTSYHIFIKPEYNIHINIKHT